MNTRNPMPADRALVFAAKVHMGQRRKYTGEPYIVHPISVGELVRSVTDDEEALTAAYLHDTLEDTMATALDIEMQFGSRVTDLVNWLTDISTPTMGNRATRKAIDRDHISRAPATAKTIKLADLIDNTATIKQHDPEFWKVYRLEKLALLEVLREGSTALWIHAMTLCQVA